MEFSDFSAKISFYEVIKWHQFFCSFKGWNVSCWGQAWTCQVWCRSKGGFQIYSLQEDVYYSIIKKMSFKQILSFFSKLGPSSPKLKGTNMATLLNSKSWPQEKYLTRQKTSLQVSCILLTSFENMPIDIPVGKYLPKVNNALTIDLYVGQNHQILRLERESCWY